MQTITLTLDQDEAELILDALEAIKILVSTEADDGVSRLSGKISKAMAEHNNVLGEPAPEPCGGFTVHELLEWLYQPQYTNGHLDLGHAKHMTAAATLIERLLCVEI